MFGIKNSKGAQRRSRGPRLALRLAEAHSRFRRGEEGSMIVFGLFVFIMMLFIAGMAIDVMRFESDRAEMQNTLDRAILAAADQEQTVGATALVQDYYVKAGLSIENLTVTPESRGGFKKVSAENFVTIDTWFMHLLGIRQLDAPAMGTAIEGKGRVEISLALDVSGSMGWCLDNDNSCSSPNRRIDALKSAATYFVDDVFDVPQNNLGTEAAPNYVTILPRTRGVKPDQVVLSLMTYAEQANIGPTLGSRFKFSDEHAASHCGDFSSADFLTNTIDPDVTIRRLPHADVRSARSSSTMGPVDLECPPETWRFGLAYSNDPASLATAINNLGFGGDTAIDIGTKWGVALLDPKASTVVDSLIAGNLVHADLTWAPADYKSGLSQKFLVIMTDGQNTRTVTLNSPFNGKGASPMVKSGTKFFYHKPGRDTSNVAANKKNDYYGIFSGSTYRWGNTSEMASAPGANRTYPQLWLEMRAKNFTDYFYAGANGLTATQAQTAVISVVGTSTPPDPNGIKDTRLKNLCAAAKEDGVVVFSINLKKPLNPGAPGYVAEPDMNTDPSSKWNVLQHCASSSSTYYLVTNQADMKAAFAQIAAAVSDLRLSL